MPSPFLLPLLHALVLFLLPAIAAAEIVAPGVTYEASQGYHVVVVDVSSGQAEVRVNHPKSGLGNDFKTVQQHAATEGAIVAINANYFDQAKGGTCGAARGFAQQFQHYYAESGCITSLGWSQSGADIFSSKGNEGSGSFRPELTELVTGGGVLLKSGPPASWDQLSMPVGRAMTALGVSADRKKLVLLVTDKTTSSVSKMKSTLTTYGAADAVFLDGGGSSRLWIQGKAYVNLAEGADRKVPVAVVVVPVTNPPKKDAGPGKDASPARDSQIRQDQGGAPHDAGLQDSRPRADGGPIAEGEGCACALASSDHAPDRWAWWAASILLALLLRRGRQVPRRR